MEYCLGQRRQYRKLLGNYGDPAELPYQFNSINSIMVYGHQSIIVSDNKNNTNYGRINGSWEIPNGLFTQLIGTIFCSQRRRILHIH